MMESMNKLREALGDCITKAGHKDKFDTYWITKDAADKLIDEIEAEIAEYYTKLPVDADGVPIRVNDRLIAYNERVDVEGVGDGIVIYRTENDELCLMFNPAAAIHVKPRTLEDVLFEFGEEFEGEMDEIAPIIVKYADEIRELLDKAGD